MAFQFESRGPALLVRRANFAILIISSPGKFTVQLASPCCGVKLAANHSKHYYWCCSCHRSCYPIPDFVGTEALVIESMPFSSVSAWEKSGPGFLLELLNLTPEDFLTKQLMVHELMLELEARIT